MIYNMRLVQAPRDFFGRGSVIRLGLDRRPACGLSTAGEVTFLEKATALRRDAERSFRPISVTLAGYTGVAVSVA